MDQQRPDVPIEEFRAAAGDHPESHAAIGEFHSEFSSAAPDPAAIAAHAEKLRAYPTLVGTFERWYLNPRVQAFLAELTATGI